MKDYTPLFDKVFEQLMQLENNLRKDYNAWLKASPQCPPNEEKKSPNEEPSVSTNSNAPMSMIPLQVPKQHKNAMLEIRKNLLTGNHELFYTYEIEGVKHEENLNAWPYQYAYPNPYKPEQPNTPFYPTITW